MVELLVHPWTGVINDEFTDETGNRTSDIVRSMPHSHMTETVDTIINMHMTMNDYMLINKNIGIWDPDTRQAIHINYVFASEDEIFFALVYTSLQNSDFSHNDAIGIMDRLAHLVRDIYGLTINLVMFKIGLTCIVEELYW